MQFISKQDKAWSGTPTKLKNVLDDYAAQCGWKRADWPKAPNALSNRLRRAKGFLKKKNILIERAKSGNRMITISKLDQPAGLPGTHEIEKGQKSKGIASAELASDESKAFEQQFGVENKGEVEYGEGEI